MANRHIIEAMETIRYTYRLRPGKKATAFLVNEWHCTRWVWNQCVSLLQETGQWAKSQDLTRWRAEREWLRAGSAIAQQQELRNFYAKRAKGQGRKKFKSAKRSLPSLGYTVNGFSLKAGRLVLPWKTSIPVVWSRSLPSEPTSVRVYRDSVGHWYASFVVRRAKEALPPTGKAVGIDWGVKTIATVSDPALDFEHHGLGKKAAAALAKCQRRMARRAPKPGAKASKGYRHAKKQAAKVYSKAANQRADLANKWAKKVVRECDQIAVEDFKPKFLAKSSMAKKAADAAIGACKQKLIEHAARCGREVRLVPPAYTTMTCSNCGAIAKQRLELDERTFCCGACGHTADRDRNAARAILARADFNPASVEGVRHGRPRSVVHPELEIPRL